MKGTKKIELGEETVTVRMTVGAQEDWQEYLEENDIPEDTQKLKHQRILFALMELYATKDEWKDPDILDKAEDRAFKYKNMGLDQIKVINDIAQEAADEVGNPNLAPKKDSK